MSNVKNHSEPLERYLKGQMSPEEAHAFERNALDDPFLMEALEGYESIDHNHITGDLQKMRKRLSSSKKKPAEWLKVAAMIAMLIVGSLAVFYLFVDIQDPQLAHTPNPVSDKVLDSIELSQEEVSEETIEEVAEEIKTAFDTDGVKVEDDKEEAIRNLLAEKEPEEMPTSIQKGESAALEYREDMASIESKKSSAELADVFFDTAAAKDELIVLEQEIPVPEQTFAAQSKELAEVRSVGARAASRGAGGAAMIVDTSDIAAKPKIGDSLYYQYLKEALIYPKAAEENDVEGVVELELTINSIGEITDIQIKKSLGYGCDEEAIRLVKDGPKWAPAIKDGFTISDEVLIHIPFKLSD